MPSFLDHFSESAKQYAAFRPDYPVALFEYLRERSPGSECVWDCGTGSGQAAVALARHFGTVIATDPSHAQLMHARQEPRVHYAVGTAEDSPLRANCAQLVTVAQALHWFQLDHFYREVRRILVADGLLAVWTYGLLAIDPPVDRRISDFYREELGRYWPPQRALVDAGYRSLHFPFRELEVPSFAMAAVWTLDQLSGYLRTWSAVASYEKALGENPVRRFIDSIAPLWGPPESPRRVTWPLEVRVGRV